ncbi:hypothetical protein WH50_11090 [Pokkaliibacter plantistimulans]|uniref:Gfo/Idh/MocA-like oxidoreductase N-terminal domain-containing protein n=1 Tax=Pokkaliibacter plantistimulans TaxID=1635171 RepID=A0ABX5M0C8_9GAMM|nr:Gfo/Idh/MocA family oxidoreductase [Pokkaliibacter plantistimulans]PXF31178.1 hypothetical protein WH50_11090 [Pokkaliibacter plantistimulans]
MHFGILGNAKIARTQVAPAIIEAGHQIHAIASRSQEQAQAFADMFGVARCYDSYEVLLADEQIEAVYIPLPNHLHVPWALKAIQAGKHVLCEKPIALDLADLHPLLDAVKHSDRVVMEAFMVCHHQQWQAIHDTILPAIGDVHAIHAMFSYANDDPANVRNVAEWGGGGLLDIGCYTVLAGLWSYGCEPLSVQSVMDIDPRFGTDRLTSALLDFGQGRVLNMTVSTQLAKYQRIVLMGRKGWAELDVPFNPAVEGTRIRMETGGELGTGLEVLLPAQNQYAAMVSAFVGHTESGKGWNNLQQSHALIQVLDKIRMKAHAPVQGVVL